MSSKKAKRKAYFSSSNPSKKSKADLIPGLKGFICTCNGNMKSCIQEALNILDDFESKNNPEKHKLEDEGDEIEDALKKELNKEKQQKKEERKFRNIDTGINNCIFIGTTADNVVEIVEKIVQEVKETKISKSRHLIRMIPIEVTCKAFLDDIKKAASILFDKHFKCDPVAYCINITKRSNNNLDRKELIEELAVLVKDRNLNHKVNLNAPVKSIIVEIIRNICCLSVVTNFNEYMRFNLISLASNNKTDTEA